MSPTSIDIDYSDFLGFQADSDFFGFRADSDFLLVLSRFRFFGLGGNDKYTNDDAHCFLFACLCPSKSCKVQTELRFVATVTTGGRVQFVPAV